MTASLPQASKKPLLEATDFQSGKHTGAVIAKKMLFLACGCCHCQVRLRPPLLHQSCGDLLLQVKIRGTIAGMSMEPCFALTVPDTAGLRRTFKMFSEE